jgi:uncharacterized membrane protein
MSKNSAQKKKQPHTVVTPAPAPVEQVSEILPTSEPSLQDYPETSKHNVSRRERLASGMLGGGLLMYGIPNFLTLPGQVSNLTGLYMVGRAVTGRCLVYSAFGIDTTPNGRLHHRGVADPHPVQLRQTLTVARPLQEVFAFCRDQDQIARCFPTVKQVQKMENHRSLWMFSDTAELVSFPVTVEITHEIENEQITWTAFPESSFRLNGNLQFKAGPHPEETEIICTVHMIPPAGIMGSTLMKWFSPVTEDSLNDVLHKLKQVLETGSITTSQSRIPHGIKDPVGGWQNRLKSHLHIRTMQSLAGRRIS